MLYITQLIYIHPGQEEVFNDFEAKAIPLIAKYNGELLLRVRLEGDSLIDIGAIDKPYEVHMVRFDTEGDFNAFLSDEQRRQLLQLREQSIKISITVKGELV